ncbi:hypothetical protein B0J15DRAFT_577263 [Fusarium solani]|uniref:Uncharacterized protein n=1 Tax=Fusarium solani TaxID=169388 RepID=A0A9P9G291_FUSSL|nr:uncharacterized protein B0J15DRAFT_577263 [Fusarium solani]KAH7229942.1 hypothetical protein B0J15DRAFT_577263 [Fusarium solani]
MALPARMEQLNDEKERKFLGIAVIRFNALDFSSYREGILGGDEPDWDYVDCLKETIRSGCSWSPSQIPALIDRRQYEEALQRKGIDGDTLNFDVRTRVECLGGLHEYLAADAVLANEHKRWRIWLYSSARRSKGKAAEIKRLLSDSDPYMVIFETFHDVPALFWGFRIGQVGKMKSLLCRPELLSYLLRIKSFWSSICLADQHQIKNIDVATVKNCSGKAPGASKEHKKVLQGLFDSRTILGKFSDEQRDKIWQGLCKATEDRLVPTLEGFFGNLEYLRQVTGCLRRLIDIKESSPQVGRVCLSQEVMGDQTALRGFVENSGNSLRNGFSKEFRKSMENQCLLQVSGDRYKLVRNEDVSQFELAYRHLLLFAFREFPAMPWQAKKKLAGAENTTDPVVLFKFAILAYKLGVRSDKIGDILRQRPQAPVFEQPDSRSRPGILSEPAVYGKPTPCDLAQYKGSIFLPNLHGPATGQKLDFDYFFVQRSLYLDLMHLFPLNGMETLLGSAVSEIEYHLLDVDFQSNTEHEGVQEVERTLSRLQEEARRLKSNIESQEAEKRVLELKVESLRRQVEQEGKKLESTRREAETELRDLAETRQSRIQRGDPEVTLLEGRKQDLESEIRQLTQQAKELRRRAHVHGITPLGSQELVSEMIQDESASSDNNETHTGPLSPQAFRVGPNEDRLAAQVQIKNGKGPIEYLEINMTEKELKAYLVECQGKGYKLFDGCDGVLTPDSCFGVLKSELPQQPILVLKPEFEVGKASIPLKRRSADQDYPAEVAGQRNQTRPAEKRQR